ncbi:MAG: hypothetical protein EXS32_04780 [Opitutus sp.]|nr:hypothetical protein [Opitutus sp.]
MKTKLLVVAVVGIAVALGLAIRATYRASQAEKAAAGLAMQDEALRQKIGGIEARLRAANAVRAESEKAEAMAARQRDAASATVAISVGETAAKSAVVGLRLSAQCLIANDPQKLAEYAKNFRLRLDLWGLDDLAVGGMFKAFDLSPEQREKFKDLQVWQELRRMDLKAAAETQGFDTGGEVYWQLKQENEKLREQKEAEIFGTGPLFEQYQEYARKQFLRDTAARLASTEFYPDTPITATQVERVTDIVAKSSQWNTKENWLHDDWGTINWDSAGAQLQGVLSPSQLGTLRLLIREKEAFAAVVKRSSELGAEARRISHLPGR